MRGLPPGKKFASAKEKAQTVVNLRPIQRPVETPVPEPLDAVIGEGNRLGELVMIPDHQHRWPTASEWQEIQDLRLRADLGHKIRHVAVEPMPSSTTLFISNNRPKDPFNLNNRYYEEPTGYNLGNTRLNNEQLRQAQAEELMNAHINEIRDLDAKGFLLDDPWADTALWTGALLAGSGLGLALKNNKEDDRDEQQLLK